MVIRVKHYEPKNLKKKIKDIEDLSFWLNGSEYDFTERCAILVSTDWGGGYQLWGGGYQLWGGGYQLWGGGYQLNMNAGVALAQAEFWPSWVASWGQANWKKSPKS